MIIIITDLTGDGHHRARPHISRRSIWDICKCHDGEGMGWDGMGWLKAVEGKGGSLKSIFSKLLIRPIHSDPLFSFPKSLALASPFLVWSDMSCQTTRF